MINKGDKAPDFEFQEINGKTLRLSDLTGKRVVLYFYPKDNTPGCTAEACSFRDHHNDLSLNNMYVIGVSADSEKSHLSFTEKFNLPFPLISDIDYKIINAYGVWGEKKFMGKTYNGILRTTFIISPEGIVEDVITKVETKTSYQQVVKSIKI